MSRRAVPALAPSRNAPAQSRTKIATPGLQEVELKLEVDPGFGALIAADIIDAHGRNDHLVTTYFDTPDGEVRRAGCSLRIRVEDGARAQTIKSTKGAASGLFTRTEWTRPVTGDRPVLDAKNGPFGPALRAIGVDRLGPRIVTDFHRTHGLIERGDGKIKWAIDDGEIRAGRHVVRLREIALELHEGSARILFDTAREIASRVPVRIAVLSKSERGYRLLGEGMTAPARAEPIQLERSANAGEAFAAIAHSCLLQFRLNEMLLIKNAEAEAVHQARVALRRLCTAFWLYRPLLAHDSKAALLEIELRWLMGRLGEVRNLDVLMPHADEHAGPGLREARERAMTALGVDLASSRVRGLMLDLAEWLAIGAWRVRPRGASDPDDIMSFAGNALRKLRKQLKRRGKGLAKLGPRRRHKVRMTAKKLRYASEFFVSLFPTAEAARRYSMFTAALSVLQDSLGELNDLDLERRALKSHAGARKRRHRHRKHNRKLLRRAARGYERLIEARRFWCVDPLPAA